MTDIDDHSSMSEDELLAAEYVLGLLAGADRAAAERRLQRDAKFAAMVAAWEQRLTPWAREIADVSPPPQVWEAIAAALLAPRNAGLWQSLVFWRGFALASALAAACLAVVVYLGAVGGSQPLVAAIEGGGKRTFVATVDTKRGTIAVVPAAFTADATRVPELWLIPADGKPRPIGVVAADRTITLAIPPEFAAQTVRDAVLAVSLEPPGGSPTGAPTGPVIGTGKLTSL
jgi:anti-sigma-K factor RskA